MIGYLGPNGAGKTTTIRLLLGLMRATAGRAEIFGIDAGSHPVEAHRHVAYVPGEANLWPSLTGEEPSICSVVSKDASTPRTATS